MSVVRLAYIDGLNEGAGMGFSLVGVKITYSLVANALISFGSVMGVLANALALIRNNDRIILIIVQFLCFFVIE